MPVKVYFENDHQWLEPEDATLAPYEKILAAGGIVINDEGELLMIFRRGKWDLPKGKTEEGETMETCAEREILEETGLQAISLQRFLTTTYHTYAEKDEPILKETHWFLFRAHGEQQVMPQTEEDISRIEWVRTAHLKEYLSGTYQLIADVVASYLG